MKTRRKPHAHRRKLNFPPRMILVPTDFSECSDAALAAARLLARRFACRLEVAHADEGPPPALTQGATDELTRRALVRYEEDLRARLEAARGAAEHVGTHMLTGAATVLVPRLAADAAADLVVMGTHGRRGLRRWALGSVAEAAVHGCRTPVLVTRRAPPEGWPRRILAPVDMSDPAEDALRMAAAWARAAGAGLTVLAVHDKDALREMPNEELCDRVEALLEDPDPEPTFLSRRGRPYEEIVAAAQDEGCDLVVVAARARGRLQDGLIGTTAERVLRVSPVPVLAVPG